MPDFHSSDRRKFLRNVGATTLAAGVVGIEPLLNTGRSIVNAAPAQGSNQRANDCAKLRRDAAQNGLNDTPQNLQHPNNQDESIYPNKIGSYSKGLTHNNDGTVVLSAYTALLKALDSGKQADFNAIPLGATRKLTNPQAGLAFDMEGPDSHALVQPPAPAFASREQAAEISENYWMALLRDVPFAFGTFGGPHIATILCEVSTRALKSVWFQKWFVHRRLRPEVHAARVDRTLYAGAGHPVHPEILNSLSSASRLGGYLPAGNALLPMAFPEGSPTHPAYGAGHATVAGACVTFLKAWFDESTRLADLGVTPVQPSDDGSSLNTYSGSDAGDLTVGGELNKIASNVANGRNIAGVHWRSDATESLKLGEQIAIGVLKDQKNCYNEVFTGFSLTKFDGTVVRV